MKISKALILFFAVIMIDIDLSYGQRNEIGISLGGAYYLGDINPSRHFAMTNAAGGILYRRNFNEHISLRLNGIYGKIEADDAEINFNPERNLHFKSSIIELSTQAEINFMPFITGDIETPYSFYIFGGIGAFRFNPKGYHNGEWHELRLLGTEGQGTELYPERKIYSRYSYNLIFGAGFKFYTSKSISAGIEWGMRRTGTDYLDDVSTTYPDPEVLSGLAQVFSNRGSFENENITGLQRGNPYTNDWYSFACITLTFKIENPSLIRCYIYD